MILTGVSGLNMAAFITVQQRLFWACRKMASLNTILAFMAVLMGIGITGTAWAESSGKPYTRCAACHLPSGAGVPSIYPPLIGNLERFFKTQAGRDYVAQVVVHGVRGKMQVDGLTYRGAMASVVGGLTPQKMTALLNDLVLRFGSAEQKKAAPLFTERQVTAVQREKVKDILSLRAAALQEAAE